jgi:hypothetical protein
MQEQRCLTGTFGGRWPPRTRDDRHSGDDPDCVASRRSHAEAERLRSTRRGFIRVQGLMQLATANGDFDRVGGTAIYKPIDLEG